MGAVNIRDEVQPWAISIRAERTASHRRAKIRAADADVHDIHKPGPIDRSVSAGTNRLGKGKETIQRLSHLGHDRLAAGRRTRASAAAQGDVKNGAAFSFINRRACKHSISPRFDVFGVGQPQQGGPGAHVQFLFRKVDQEVSKPVGMRGKAVRVRCKEVTQAALA